MIKDDNQLRVTKERVSEFQNVLKELRNSYLLAKAQYESTLSVCEELLQEIAEYENNREISDDAETDQ